MSVRELLKSVGLVALAAGSLVALPIEVLAKGNRDWSGDGGGRHHGGGRGGDGGGAQRAQRQQQAQLPQVQAPQVQVPNVQYRQQHMPRQVDAPAQVQWRGNRDAGQAQNIRPRQQRQWSGEGGSQPRRLRQPDAAVPDAGRVERGRVHGGDRGNRQIRNRSYVDPGRNVSYRDGNRDNNWSDGDRHGGDRSRWNDGRHGHNDGWRGGDNRRWSNNWRHDNRYDWHGHRNRYGNRYRLGSYYAPYRNYYYSPLSIGLFMDSLFFSSNYWISDPYEYRLPPVYGPYRWVRYYDDVVLVDIYSGEVVDVIRNFFW